MNGHAKSITAKSVFLDAVESCPPDEWKPFLDRECQGNPELRRQVERLLAGHRNDVDLIGKGADALRSVVPTLLQADYGELGAQIGPYKLREVLGEGGMGIVYAAEQEQPIRRSVALKVIKPGMDTREVIARFEAERQALALMDHPNIAKIIDAGTTGGFGIQDSGFRENDAGQSPNPESRFLNHCSGRPYFVMELVRGMPLTTYCDQAKLPLHERLKLFITVCQAVQHAHQKGIIHRDLKPSNVMVTVHDGTPVPKIIDFGIAKALNQRLTENTIYTRNAQLLGTPLYMSPEQAELSGLDVDARSDVYSLGVLLYELLTGNTPFDKESFAKLGYDQVCRIIREDEPPRPSARISTLGEANRSTVASRRGVDDRRFARTLRGELDWIVMKALEKDRTRRYGGADALAADSQRFLDEQPVQACPPALGYRMRKFVRRKSGVVAASLFALSSGVALAAVIVIVRDQSWRGMARVVVPEGGAVSVGGDDAAGYKPSTASERTEQVALPGLIAHPYTVNGVGRWQIVTRAPSSSPREQWNITWSPDSRSLCFGDGNDLRIYSIPDFRLVRVFTGHTSAVVAVDWSKDGRSIASTSLDNSIRLWDASSGIPGPVLIGHRSRVNAVAWHPGGHLLASGSSDNTVRLWSREGKPGAVLTGHSAIVRSVAWNSDGILLSTTGDDGTIRIWDADGNPRAVLNPQNEGGGRGTRFWSLDWSPDDQQLLVAQFSGPGRARIWNLDGTPGLEFPGHRDPCVATASWHPEGQLIASGGRDNTVRLWDIDGTPGAVLRHDGNLCCVKWSPDGQWLAAGSHDRAIHLWGSEGQAGPVLKGDPFVSSVSWKPDGSAFAAGVSDHTVRIIDAEGNQEAILEGHTRAVARVAWSPDGDRIASSSIDRSLRVWNVKQRGLAATMVAYEHPGPYFEELEPRGLAWSPNSLQIASTYMQDQHQIRTWSRDGKAGVILKGHQHHLYEVAFNPINGQLASVSQDGTLRVWSPEGSIVGVFTVGNLVSSVAWSPDGTQVACGSKDGTIQMWSPDGRPGALLQAHTTFVRSIDWSSDGRLIASGGGDNLLRVWSSDGELLADLTTHTGHKSIRWRPHSTQFLSAGLDGMIRLWDVRKREAEWVLIVLDDGGTMKFSIDGHRLAGDEAKFERDFLYMVEKPTGATELLTTADFKRRFQQTTP